MPLEALLAFRFLVYSAHERSIASMLKICFFSILLATFSLTLVSALMTGLEKETHKKLQGVHADLYIDADKRSIDYEKVKKVLCADYSSSIVASSPLAYFHALLVANAQETQTALCLVKIIDPTTEPLVSSLHKTILTSSNLPCSAWNTLSAKSIALGKPLAERLHLKEGDSITLYYPGEQALDRQVSLKAYQVTIGALYKTGIQELDEHLIIASFSLFKELYQPAVSQIMLKLAPHAHEKSVIASLQKRLSLSVYSWKALYEPLFAALTLEKYALIFIVSLIALVVLSSIIALLFMYVAQKRTEIALLKAMGMADNALTRLFIMLAFIITCGATFCGIILAWLAVLFLQKFPFIQLPDAYYVTYLPAELTFPIVLAVSTGACIIALIGGFIPSRTVHSTALASILKGVS